MFVAELCWHNPDAAWPVVCKLIEIASERDLGVVGAGPLDGLLAHHGDAVIGLVESRVRVDKKLRDALSSVWPSSLPMAHGERLKAAARDLSTD
jgi:hypothetical protein